MTTIPDELLRRARAWLEEDPDPETRAELTALLEEVTTDPQGRGAAVLVERFSGTLQFGTAGLRGALGAGPTRMNRVVVIRAAAGLASYLATTAPAHGGPAPAPVVVGYDARRNSDVFARDTAEVLTGAGRPALLLPGPLPTPVLAFAIRHLSCAAGVMVTASHNPPQDNGYKVYLGDGSQIVHPADQDIAAAIEAVGPLAGVPRAAGAQVLAEDVLDAYVDAVGSLAEPGPRDIRAVYTPLHGVGAATVARVLERAGFPAPQVVPSQADPDPRFPTLAFPNPEEPGAMDRAIALATESGADLVVANDPDADRCAVAVPGPDGWRTLSGDELGALLGDFLLRRGVAGVYAASIVSSSLLRKLAASHGQEYAETLTGFKWIARVPRLVFGYEEALGYCVAPQVVRDKDGISALVLVLELAAGLRAQGRTLRDRLDEIALEHGLHATDQLSLRVDDPGLIEAAMADLRTAPPQRLGDLHVDKVEDLTKGTTQLPPTDGLRFTLDQRARVVVRPSGTEPKLKCYLEVVVPVAGPPSLAEAHAAAERRLGAIREDLAGFLGITAGS